jgi:hypothetical protein
LALIARDFGSRRFRANNEGRIQLIYLTIVRHTAISARGNFRR